MQFLFLLGLTCGFIVLLTYYKIQFSLDWSTLRFSPAWFGLAFCLGVLQHIIASLLWSAVLRSAGILIATTKAIRAYLIGDLGKYLPGKVWVVAGKAALVAKEGVALPVALGAATQETLFVLVSGALISLAYLPFAIDALTSVRTTPLVVIPVAAGALLIAVHPGVQTRLLRLLSKLSKHPQPIFSLCIRKTLILIIAYCGLWLLAGLQYFFIFISISALPAPSWPIMTGIVAFATITGFAAVFAPGGLGVREATMATLLLPFTSVEVAATFALLARLVVTASQGSATIAGLAFTGLDKGALVAADRTTALTEGNGTSPAEKRGVDK